MDARSHQRESVQFFEHGLEDTPGCRREIDFRTYREGDAIGVRRGGTVRGGRVTRRTGSTLTVRHAYGRHSTTYDETSFHVPKNTLCDGSSFDLVRVPGWRAAYHTFYDED